MAVRQFNMKDKRTYADRRKYIIDAVSKRRKSIRLKAISYRGSKCMKCGYSKYPEVLEFHHRHPKVKDFNVSAKGHCRSWDRVKIEVEKCDLLCANCHREAHVEQKLAASKGNFGMKKRVNSGKPRTGNPEPSFHGNMIEGAETRHSPPKAIAKVMV